MAHTSAECELFFCLCEFGLKGVVNEHVAFLQNGTGASHKGIFGYGTGCVCGSSQVLEKELIVWINVYGDMFAAGYFETCP